MNDYRRAVLTQLSSRGPAGWMTADEALKLLAKAILSLEQEVESLRSGDWSKASVEAETTPLSQDTEPTEGQPSMSNASSIGFYLVREDILGQWTITATVTQAELNSIPNHGKALKGWLVEGLIPLTPSTWGWLSRSGSTPSTTQAAPEDGPSVGGDNEAITALDEAGEIRELREAVRALAQERDQLEAAARGLLKVHLNEPATPGWVERGRIAEGYAKEVLMGFMSAEAGHDGGQ